MNREITVPCKNIKMVFLCIPETELGTEIVYQDCPLNCHRFLPKSSCILRRSRESDAAANWILLISFHLCTIKPTFSITRRKSSPSRFSWLFADSFEIRLGRSSTSIVGLKFRQANRRGEKEIRKENEKIFAIFL